MKNKKEEEKYNPWWSSLDGDLDSKQRSEMDQKRSQDLELDLHFQKAQRLDEALKTLETDQPSMRFTQKVMEALPFIYRKITIEPLLKKRMLWVIAIGITLLAIATILPAFFISGEYSAPYMNPINSLSEQFAQLPSKWFIISSALSIGFIGIFTLDRSIKKMILRSKKT